MKHRNITVLAALALLATLIPATVSLAAVEDLVVNEVDYDQASTDTAEFVEIFNPGSEAVDLSLVELRFVNGFNGAVYDTIALSGSLASGEYFVVCANDETTPNCDLDDGPDTNFIQNGAPDAVAIVRASDGAIIDTISYEGETTGFTEGSGAGTDDPDRDFMGLSRIPDGTDTDDNSADFSFVCITPGASNLDQESDCTDPLPPAEPTPLDINTIQGDGFSSPHEGDSVRVDGVVTAVFQDDPVKGRQLGGFFMQEAEEDWDDNTSTSEGIFVFAPFEDVEVGQVVEVVGTVAEFDQLTEITSVESVTVIGTATVTPIEFTLPATDAQREAVEGMLLSLTQDLHIVEFFDFDRTNEVVLATTRQYQGTHSAPPGPQAVAIAEQNALNQIRIDDARTSQNPGWNQHPDGSEYTEDNSFRGGDLLLGVTGVMHEGVPRSFGSIDYRVQPTGLATHVETNTRPTAPDDVGGNVTVASFNVLNFFTHIDSGPDICGPTQNLDCRGADSQEEFVRQLTKLVLGIQALDADIVGLQEIENDIHPVGVDGNRAHDPVLRLVEELNAVDGAGTWAWVGETNHYNNYPVRNDIIYKPASVQLVGDPIAVADEAFDATRPGDIEPLGRPPLAQTFRQNGPGSNQPFTVVVNHFKSKGSSCASIGDQDIGDGQGSCNLTRVAQSEALLGFVDELSENSSGVLVIGDLNSYAMEDPITTLEDAGLTDLVEEFVGADAYSFVFDGQLGYLDTALATRSMLNWVTGTTVFHINADEPDIIDYDTSFKSDTQIGFYEPNLYRASDHDPVIVGLSFGGPKKK